MANGRRSKKARRDVPTAPAADAPRVGDLVVCRESAAYDYLLFEGMVQQTLQALPGDLPGVDEVRSAGVGPVRREGPFAVTVLSRDGTQAVLFEHMGVYYLYSLGSAAKTIVEREENAFVEILCDVLVSLQPMDVHCATFSRLLRSLLFSGHLESVFRRSTERLRCGPSVIEFNTPSGKAMWHTLAMISDMERDAIVQRLFAGLVNKYNRGAWILNDEAVPPGYRIEDERGVLDADMVEPTRVLLQLMADHELPARSIVDEAGRLGLSSPTIRRLYGEDATFTHLRRADSRIASIIDWIPTYETGVVTIKHPVPYDGATSFGGLEVHKDENGEYVEFKYQWEVPDGGWLAPEILTAAKRRAVGRKARCRKHAGPRRQKPLVGFRWTTPTHAFRFGSQQRLYRIMRQVATPADDEVAEEPS